MRRTFDFHVNFDLATAAEELQRCISHRFDRPAANWIESGLAVAQRVHAGQSRGDGSPYVVHPVRVALLVLKYERRCSGELVVACLLHDALEDTDVKEKEIQTQFGPLVAQYVSAVTRLRPVAETPEQRRDGKISKWNHIMNARREVRVIKTFDYCDNVISWRFIAPGRPAFRKIPRWLFEAKTLYLPLAEVTNSDAARLLQSEIEYYISVGHKIGDWLL